jgi:two-component system, NtrC family, response regulator HydG
MHESGNSRKPTSILVVDDNKSLLTTLSMVLRHHGYNVKTASGGEQAIGIVREHPFDIIFMDVKMPVMNGVETFKRIKSIRSESVVIMMTAYEVEELLQEAIEAGAYGILNKPFEVENAISMIEESISSEKGKLILIVDDDYSTCITLKNILTEQGYGVGTAFTGEDALLMAGDDDFSIVFIDMNLPAMNGLETYLAMRKQNPRLIAIMITGYRNEMEDLLRSAMDHQAYACLNKPLDPDQVLEIVGTIRNLKVGHPLAGPGSIQGTSGVDMNQFIPGGDETPGTVHDTVIGREEEKK